MANPVINTATSITGHLDVGNITTTPTNVVTVAANTILKINSIRIGNNSTSSAGLVTVQVYRSATEYSLQKESNVAIGSSLTVIDERDGIFLMESDSIRLTTNINSVLQYFISYEKIAS